MRFRPSWISRWAPVGALALLAGMTWQQMAQPSPEDAEPYHNRVERVVNDVPYELGAWEAVEVPVPQAAVDLLRPNAILSRRYRNQQTGASVSLLVVHCRDARDMAGHYPPICYPANGWSEQQRERVTLRIGDRRLHAAEYQFQQQLPTRTNRMWVVNTLVLPDGRTTPEMSIVRRAAADYLTRFFGAAQIQMIFNGEVSASQRRALFERFLGELKPVLKAVSQGVEER